MLMSSLRLDAQRQSSAFMQLQLVYCLLCVADVHAGDRGRVMVQGRMSMAQLVIANQSLLALMLHVMHTPR